jgi:hypothetical protein
MGVTYVKRYRVGHKNQWGERIQNFEVFVLYETAKFTGDQSDLLGKLE